MIAVSGKLIGPTMGVLRDLLDSMKYPVFRYNMLKSPIVTFPAALYEGMITPLLLKSCFTLVTMEAIELYKWSVVFMKITGLQFDVMIAAWQMLGLTLMQIVASAVLAVLVVP